MTKLDIGCRYPNNAIRFQMPYTEIRLFRAGTNGTVPLMGWLEELEAREPRAYQKCLERILLLSQLGSELRRPHVDTLRDGIRELRVRVGRVHYRMLFFFCGPNIACITHGLTKEGKVPDTEIDLAVRRKKLLESEPEKYTASWEE